MRSSSRQLGPCLAATLSLLVPLTAHAGDIKGDKVGNVRVEVPAEIQTILKIGDGLTPSTAYVVKSPDQMEKTLAARNLHYISEAPVPVGGHHYTMMLAAEKDGTIAGRFYFILEADKPVDLKPVAAVKPESPKLPPAAASKPDAARKQGAKWHSGN